jgi:hypothetical protein
MHTTLQSTAVAILVIQANRPAHTRVGRLKWKSLQPQRAGGLWQRIVTVCRLPKPCQVLNSSSLSFVGEIPGICRVILGIIATNDKLKWFNIQQGYGIE